MRTEYSVTFQWRPGGDAILRLHEKAGAKYGDPYIWWTVIAVHEGGTVEFMGTDKPIPLGGPKAIVSALKLAGFKQRRHDRIVDGRKRTVIKGV